MALGARPGLIKLYRDFGHRIKFVSVYTREAHPGERYPHHESEEQKLQHARDWMQQDALPWTIAVDILDGSTHRAYGSLPNSAYLIDTSGHVAFRALWAGQERLLRDRISELLKREGAGEAGINLGQRENLIIPMIHGAAEFDRVVARAGEKSKRDFRRELGILIYAFQKVMSKVEPIINPGNSPIN